jgi:hypothetical protein
MWTKPFSMTAVCVHPHRLLVGRLVARDAMAALGDQILDRGMADDRGVAGAL